MAYFSTESAESAIGLLKSYMSAASSDLEKMHQAGRNCADNMKDDQAAEKANIALSASITAIQKNIEHINDIINGIEKQKEHYERIRSAANSF